MKKTYLVVPALTLLLMSQNVQAATLNGKVRSYENEAARDLVVKPEGNSYSGQINWQRLTNSNGVKVTVTDDSGAVVYDGVTAHSSSAGEGGVFSVPNLAAGTYTVTLTQDTQTPLPYVIGGPSEVQYDMTATVTLENDDDNKTLWWALVAKSKRVTAVTKIGTLPAGVADKDANNEDINYRVWYAGGDKAIPRTVNGINYVYFNGALYGDTLSMYSKVVTEPTLSADEKAYGYTFKGWRVNNSSEIYTSAQVLSMRVTSDIQLEAVWEAPTYSVTFATDTEKGDIAGQATTSYAVEGNVSTVGTVTQNTLPSITAKEGYTFLGWYVDNTTNIVSDSDIQATKVNKNLVYYAKYKKNTPDISIGANNNWYIDGVDTGKSSVGKQGEKGDAGESITVTNTTTDANGNTVITFSDGTVTTVLKGKDGQDGAKGDKGEAGAAGQNGTDGKDGSSVVAEPQNDGSINVYTVDSTGTKTLVGTLTKGKDGQDGAKGDKGEAGTAGQNGTDGKDGSSVVAEPQDDGSINVYKVDSTGTKTLVGTLTKGKDGQDGATGQNGTDGKDGQSVTIISTKVNDDRSVLVTFSDGTTLTIPSGLAGQDGKDGADGKDGKDGKDGSSLTVSKTEFDTSGNTVITFSDGTKTVINRGSNGTDGKSIKVTDTTFDATGNTIVTFNDGTSALITKGADGKSPTVTIGTNGRWYVDGVDTGISAEGKSTTNIIASTASTVTDTIKGILPNTGEFASVIGVVGSLFGMSGAYILGRRNKK